MTSGPLRGADRRRLVVVDPVADIFHAGFDQQFRRLERLRQARPEPADRPLAGEFFEDVHRAVDHAALILVLVDRHLVVGVAHELPAKPPALLGDARVVLAGARVDGERRPDAEPLVELEEPPCADPHAVFVPAPVRHVRQERHAGRRRQHLARHRPADVPHLIVNDGPDHEPRTARQLERRTVDDGRKFAAVAWQHGGRHRLPGRSVFSRDRNDRMGGDGDPLMRRAGRWCDIFASRGTGSEGNHYDPA